MTKPKSSPDIRTSSAFSWRRYGWAALTGLYGVGCLLALLPGRAFEDPRAQMSLLVLGFFFFVLGFFQYFYVLASFSKAARWRELQTLQQPPPRLWLLGVWLALGLSAIVALLWLMRWRGL